MNSRTFRSRTRSSLVHLYAERGSPKYEKAALRWLERYRQNKGSDRDKDGIACEKA